MRRYNLSDEAKADLADIKAYLTKEGGAPAARYVLTRIKEGMDFLSRTPGAGHLREDLTDTTVKFWPVFSYRLSTRQPRAQSGSCAWFTAAAKLHPQCFQKTTNKISRAR